jgi:predicted lysophospholipase L1 biosynthesis ABC-type transport system permease subunit
MVVIVSRSLAEQYWNGRDPVGDAIITGGQELRIVGMVGDVRQMALADEPAPALYVSHRQVPRTGMTIAVRVSGDPAMLIGAIQREIWDLRADQPIEDIATMDTVIGESVAQPRFAMALLSLFAGLALCLASVGVYGVISYAVGARSHEIGIRIALGARPRDVQQLVINGAVGLSAVGIGAGLLVAAGSTWLMQSLLFDVPAIDLVTFGAVSTLLFTISLAAAIIPAWRASTHDPLSTIRDH